jgi:hypothetical protein
MTETGVDNAASIAAVGNMGEHNRFGPGAVTVDIGRASTVSVGVGAVLLALLTAASVYAVIDADETAVAVVGSVFAVLFGLMFLFLLVSLPKVLQPRGLVFDGAGLHTWHGSAWDLVTWAEIAALGIGYEQPPDVPKLPTSLLDAAGGVVEDKLKQALKFDDKRKVALEIFPVDARCFERHPSLVRYRKSGPVPTLAQPDTVALPALLPERWRVGLPPALGVAKATEHGARTFATPRWLGWFARPWTGGLRLPTGGSGA